jgi:hypothetical protein
VVDTLIFLQPSSPLSCLNRYVPPASFLERNSAFTAVAIHFPRSLRMKGPSADLFAELNFLLYKNEIVHTLRGSFQAPRSIPLDIDRLGA